VHPAVGHDPYAYKRMEDVTVKAIELLKRMVPRAYNIEVKRKYRERHTPIDVRWDVLVGIFFDHKGPLPANVEQLKLHAKIAQQLKKGLGN
jgi:hypothetical protein